MLLLHRLRHSSVWQLRPALVRHGFVFLMLISLGLCGRRTTAVELEQRTIGDTQFVRFPSGTCVCDIMTISAAASELSGKRATVKVSAFWLATTEVTVGQFARFCSATSYRTDAEIGPWKAIEFPLKREKTEQTLTWRNPGFDQTDDHPATCVTYRDSIAYCEWLSKSHRRRFRLPTTAEWEYACRYGSSGNFNFDESAKPSQFANLADKSMSEFEQRNREWSFDDGHVFTAPVRAKSPGRNGLRLMHGNVAELCQAVPELCANGLFVTDHAVLRGGGWPASLKEASGNMRSVIPRVMPFNIVGFRVACEDD